MHTLEEKRAIQILINCQGQSLEDSLNDYYSLIDVLIFLHEANSDKDVKFEEWKRYSETLFYKFIFHSLSLHQIYSGQELNSKFSNKITGRRIIDLPSGKTVLRAQFECFLMYHHIYVNPEYEDLKQLRYYAWIYTSLLQRQSYYAESENAIKQKESDLKEIQNLKEIIIELESFKTLSEKQQRSLLELGHSKLFNKWNVLIKESGFPEGNFFHQFYSLLSIYAHSEGLSMLQMEYQGINKNAAIDAARTDLIFAKMLLCLMVQAIKSLFRDVKDRFESLPDELKIDIEIYCSMAKKFDPHSEF